MKSCTLCGVEYDDEAAHSLYAEAGEWLAAEVWHDAGQLCPRCLESRAMLVMMYHHEYNS